MPSRRRAFNVVQASRLPVPMASRRGAFTLVELLVVVGIIAVLIAILMPALAKVRKHAQELHCAANLHSIGQALTMYVAQYRYYPGCYGFNTPNAFPAIWPTRLRAFTGGDRSVFNCPAQDERFHWKRDGPGGPASYYAGEVEASSFGYDVGERLIAIQGSYFTYGYNVWGAGDRRDHGLRGLGAAVAATPELLGAVRNQNPPIVAGRVKCPAEMIAIADSIPDGSWDFAIDGSVDPGSGIGIPRGWPGSIHRGGANVLFCDGHVTWYLQRDLVGYTDATRRMWHNDHEP